MGGRGILVGAALVGLLSVGGLQSGSASAVPAAKGPRATLTVAEATPGQPAAVVVRVRGASIASAEVSVDGGAPSPLAVSGRTATGAIAFDDVGTHTVTATVRVRNGKRATASADVAVLLPTPTRVQLVYLYPAGTAPVADRSTAISHTAQVAKAWFAGQMGGRSPRFATDATGVPAVSVVESTLDAATMAGPVDVVGEALPQWRAQGLVGWDAMPLVYIEGRQGNVGNACGWTSHEGSGAVVIPMGNCDIYPSIDSVFPYGSSYLVAHELTHALGAVSRSAPHSDGTGHVNDDPRDMLFNGNGSRDWDNLTLDPGHDDYYGTGRADLVNIETSSLLE